MNYFKHYKKLIRKAQSRSTVLGYFENHHIFPQAIFGKNDVTVNLTAKEHYIAHFLIWKLYRKRYGDHHWKTAKAFGGFNQMTWCSKNHKRMNTKQFSYIRSFNAFLMTIDNPAKRKEVKEKISKQKKNKKRFDMSGKNYFGSNKSSKEIMAKAVATRKQNMENNMKIFGKKFNYPDTHKSTGPCDEFKKKNISNSYKERFEKYKLMSDDEAREWILKTPLKRKDGRPNSNIGRFLKLRNETKEKYGIEY